MNVNVNVNAHVGSISGGNCSILKPSEVAVQTALAIAE